MPLLAPLLQGKVMGEKEVGLLLRKYDRDGNSVFDMVCMRMRAWVGVWD